MTIVDRGSSLIPPAPREVAAIVAIADPIVRNLRITLCYAQLSAAVATRTGTASNWCTFATWASRQAGATIRGEDMLDTLRSRLNLRSQVQHPIRSLWRALLRRGLFRPDTRLGRLVSAIHTPFDAFEATSAAVARGNLKVFAEIGAAFAQWLASCPADVPVNGPEFTAFLSTLRDGDPPEGQGYLRQAFTCYQQQRFESNPRSREELIAFANLQIGWHEQTRLQPEILSALNAPLTTVRDLKERLRARFPGHSLWQIVVRHPLQSLTEAITSPVRRFAEQLSRDVITECLMVLAMPDGTALRLGHSLEFPIPDDLRSPKNTSFAALFTRFERCQLTHGDSGADDWSDLDQRMHFILHLFCAFHLRADLFSSPFSDAQISNIIAGRLPDGRL